MHHPRVNCTITMHHFCCINHEKQKKLCLPQNYYYLPATTSDNIDFKEKLIATVKKEVKQVMEEAVTKKYIHEESGSVTSLCSAVEACLSQGLRRRALGLFKTSSTTALLHKVAKVSW